MSSCIIAGSIARTALRRYFGYSWGDFEFFPSGATCYTDCGHNGVTFDGEESTKDRQFHAKFTQIGAGVGCWTQN